MNISKIATILPVAALLLASCASQKSATTSVTTATKTTTATTQDSPELQQLTFVQKVYDNQVYTQNIVGNMTFTLQHGDKDISVPGSLHMRKDAVIRLQLFVPLLGSEVGRLEFTPDKVLMVDRLHKEYIEAGYDEVDFLKENGISFYSLQALFWNQLFLPGQQKLSESALKKFTVDTNASGNTLPVSAKSGNMTYQWNANKTSGRIEKANIKYQSATHGTSSLNWTYNNFTSVGVKSFPALQSFTFATSATKTKQEATVTIKMSEVKTDSKWDTTTTISSKYKKVDAEDILKKLTNL